VTVNKHETHAVLDAFLDATKTQAVPVSLDDRIYNDLGTINGTRVFHALSEMGSGSLGAMQQTVDKAIRSLDPGVVIAVGIAFGVNKQKQGIGDILVSKQLRPYELQRAGEQIILRADKPHSTPRLINHFELFTQSRRWTGAKVRPGVIISGEKLIDNVNYRDQLLKLEVEAVGGEMEGAGLYVSCQEHKVDWIVIKAICDWADGKKNHQKEERQLQAAKNAAEFVVESLRYAPLKHGR
jgi:nucleoside phosphorylase